MLEKYPPYQTEFASGVVSWSTSHSELFLRKWFWFQIESVAFPNKCIDSLGGFYKEMGMYFCGSNKINPGGHQHYYLGHHRDIEFFSDSAYCIEPRGDKLELHACHHKQGGQYFRYDPDTQQIKNGVKEKNCMEADENHENVHMKKCNSNEPRQRWIWGRMNDENLRHWKSAGARIL